MQITNILRGIGGEFEITRVLGSAGVASYIIVANGLMIYECWYLQKAFDIIAYCAAFPAGLGVAITAIGITAGVKDRNVATATNNATAPKDTTELPESEKLP